MGYFGDSSKVQKVGYFSRQFEVLLWVNIHPNVRVVVIFYFIEKANGIEYLYAWLDKHPDVRAMVVTSVDEGKVGNSSYYKVLIETDSIISQIAEENGFQLDEIRIARYLRSSGQQNSAKLRESIIVLSKT